MSKAKTRRLSNSSRSALSNVTPISEPTPQYPIAYPDTMPDRYVVHCAGTCLEPEISDGAPVVVEKHSKIAPGDLVVLFFKPEHVPTGKHQAILMRIVLPPPSYVSFPWREHPMSDVHAVIIVEMLNPPKQFAYKCEHLLGVHKCAGTVPADWIHDAKRKTYRAAAGDNKNLSASRVLVDLAENAATIPAVDLAADGRSASDSEITDPSPIAPPARTSRRGFLMNSIVSSASLATTATVVAPAIVIRRRRRIASARWPTRSHRRGVVGETAERRKVPRDVGRGLHKGRTAAARFRECFG